MNIKEGRINKLSSWQPRPAIMVACVIGGYALYRADLYVHYKTFERLIDEYHELEEYY